MFPKQTETRPLRGHRLDTSGVASEVLPHRPGDLIPEFTWEWTAAVRLRMGCFSSTSRVCVKRRSSVLRKGSPAVRGAESVNSARSGRFWL